MGDDLQSQALAVQRPVALRLVWAVFVAFSIYAVCAFAARVNAPADEATAETAIETSQRQAAGHSVGDDGAVVLLDVAMAIDSAVVRRADESQPCVAQPDRHRHVCGREDWAFTGRYYAQFGGRAGRCLWLHPASGGLVTKATWTDHAVGAQIRGEFGLVEGSGAGDAVAVEIWVGGERVGRVEASDDLARHRFDFSVPPGMGRADVEVRWSAQRHDWRMGCLDLQMVGKRSRP